MLTLLLLITVTWVMHFLYPVYYSIAVAGIKQEQYKKIETGKGTYVYMTLPTSVIHEAKAGNELQFGDDRYDIVSISIKGNSAHCVLLYDSKETHLNKHLVRYTRNNRRTSDNTKRIFFWGPAGFLQPFNISFYSLFNADDVSNPQRPDNILLNGFLQSITHPPNLV